ncbi:MAG: sodium/solute symporter [Prevotella sp.]|nr:sodium/solute symporter [Prevotella sp.]
MNSHYMQGLDWLILAIYFAVLLAIGVWASSKRKKGGALFLAERSLRWHHIGFSMWGTNVGPSMLIASASAGFTTGIVSGNYAWYAFVFIALLAFVFAPRYLGARVHTLPEFMGLRFGQSTRNILAWYTIITIIISWLALTLFAGGILIRQVFDIPMWSSALVLLVISAFFTMLGGLKAVAYTNVYQMILLIVVSLVLVIVGLDRVGGITALVDKVPRDYWVMFKPNSDEAFPWLPIVLGYPVMGVWFWCTDQSMVQPVLAARDLREGQLGTNLTGWLKILDVALYILPGILCYALFPTLDNPDEAYLTMVENLFPEGMVGLVFAVLTACLVSTIGSALNALSTVFTMDIYVKRFRPNASQRRINYVGRLVTVVGALLAIVLTVAIDAIKGLNLFNVFQSVLGFIAPPMAAVFVLGIFWRRTTTRAANFALTVGTAFCLLVGVLYLWGPQEIHFSLLTTHYSFLWPHFMLLSFYLFVILVTAMAVISLMDRDTTTYTIPAPVHEGFSRLAVGLWIALAVVMVALYVYFN